MGRKWAALGRGMAIVAGRSTGSLGLTIHAIEPRVLCPYPDRDVTMNEHNKLNYVEFPCASIGKTKTFFEQAFGWSFVDYGPDYTSFSNQGLDGGFFKSDLRATTDTGSALLVIYSARLEESLTKVQGAGGVVIKPIFSFPGGRRFHFTEPSGNEFAVWSE